MQSCIHSVNLRVGLVALFVCLTIFVSVFSSGADTATHYLDVFAAGPAIELVNSMVSPAHCVSHLRLVFYMHAEVDPVHTEYLLGIRSAHAGQS